MGINKLRNIIDKINLLIIELNKNNQNQIVPFFEKLAINLKHGSQDEIQTSLLSLSKSMSMSQYGNFSYKEDTLLLDISSESIKLIQNGNSNLNKRKF